MPSIITIPKKELLPGGSLSISAVLTKDANGTGETISAAPQKVLVSVPTGAVLDASTDEAIPIDRREFGHALITPDKLTEIFEASRGNKLEIQVVIQTLEEGTWKTAETMKVPQPGNQLVDVVWSEDTSVVVSKVGGPSSPS